MKMMLRNTPIDTFQSCCYEKREGLLFIRRLFRQRRREMDLHVMGRPKWQVEYPTLQPQSPKKPLYCRVSHVKGYATHENPFQFCYFKEELRPHL